MYHNKKNEPHFQKKEEIMFSMSGINGQRTRSGEERDNSDNFKQVQQTVSMYI